MAAAASRVYTVSMTRIAVTAAITLIQYKAGATVPAQIIRVVIGQTSSAVSTQQAVQLNKKSGAATVTTFSPLTKGPSTDPAASGVGGTSATGTNASAEGTDGNIIRQDVFNYLSGWTYLPSPKEWDFIDAATFMALKFPVAPGASVTITADMLVEELA